MLRYSWEEITTNDLTGKTFVLVDGMKNGSDEITFMYHEQDCCEGVSLEDVCGDVDNLLGSPIITAWENSNRGKTEWGSETYTFYILGTIKGTVVLRWCGSSNGYYSEDVCIKKDPNEY